MEQVYSPEMLKELDKHSKAIHSGLGKINVDIEKVAFNLYWIYDNKAYKAMGHESIIDYAKQEFDFAKSSTYNFINIVEYFGERDKDGKLTLKGFDSDYKDYSYSKLVLLTGVQKKDIEYLGVTPDMSVRDIKKLIKDSITIGSINNISLSPDSNPVSDNADTPESKTVIRQTSDNENVEDNKDKEVSAPDIQDKDLYSSDCLFIFKKYHVLEAEINDVLDYCRNALESRPGSQIEINWIYSSE